ncbi:unnamed protein product [Rhizophagus irregularis]|nr:unnamed protein product [Rhizophagus irregularis]CAB4396614.1 unnamed protein product [Rhizophagus irregularis]CAB5302651.1 unnamed protein product [Rhizophagus irregularis]
MYQLQTNEKTSTKRICPSGSNRPGAQKKKTSDVTRSTPRLILPKSPLTEQQQQNILQLPSQRQQQGVIQLSQPWQQQNILPQLQQEVTFQNISYGQYVPEINPQLCKLPPILPEIEEGCDESALLFREDVLHDKNPQPEKTNISKQSFAKKKGNDDQDQDLDEKSGVNKEANAIKGKLSRLIKKYENVKKHNNQSGVERKDCK